MARTRESIQKRVVLITGAARGIGRASAEMLLEHGFVVYGGDLASAQAELRTIEHADFHALEMDVRSDEEVEAAVGTVIGEQGQIDVLVANAGYSSLGPIELVSIEEAKAIVDVNLFGTTRVINAALPHMRERGTGRIVITSSPAGQVAMPIAGWYCATKHAQQAIGDVLRLEVKGFGIHVSLIEPGTTATQISFGSAGYLEEVERRPNAGPYLDMMRAIGRVMDKDFANGAPPSRIAKDILHASTARRPKRRYHSLFDAKVAIFARHYFGYWLVDRLLLKMVSK